MNDMRNDLGYLLRQLQKAADPQVSAEVRGIPMRQAPDAFLETMLQIYRERQESLALLHQAKAELRAINDELPVWWALLEREQPDAIRAAE